MRWLLICSMALATHAAHAKSIILECEITTSTDSNWEHPIVLRKSMKQIWHLDLSSHQVTNLANNTTLGEGFGLGQTEATYGWTTKRIESHLPSEIRDRPAYDLQFKVSRLTGQYYFQRYNFGKDDFYTGQCREQVAPTQLF